MLVASVKELRRFLPPKARLLGMDHGEKTLGLALSDPGLSLSTPFRTLRQAKFTQYVNELRAICKDYEVGGFVIGLPLNMDGSEGRRAESVRSFGDNLLKSGDMLGFEPVILFWDERLSSHAAETFLIEERDMRRDKRAEIIDSLAASNILQGALDALAREQSQ